MNDKKYYLDFGPELIKLLGPNLYTNIYYVLGEIIANAYDADANNVYISYNNSKKTVIVEDDGSGMTYEDFNNKYLQIGTPTRDENFGGTSEKYNRLRMGRKGIGKLSALSVSESVKVMSIKDGVKSGCILSLNIKKEGDGRWSIPGIDEKDIEFKYINDSQSGSAIVMEKVKHPIHKTFDAAKNNISKLFPFISEDFKIHIIDEEKDKKFTISDSTTNLIKLSDALITFSDKNSTNTLDKKLNGLHTHFDNDRYYKKSENTSDLKKYNLHLSNEPICEIMPLENNEGIEKNYKLIIKGWIATYANLPSNNKKENDFPKNYISIISHGKLGCINVIPMISTKRTYESYVIGEFFVDLLEDSDLPDIASSNRQGYKESDPRFVRTLELIREKGLKPITNLKSKATEIKHQSQMENKIQKEKDDKNKMNRMVSEIISDPTISTAIAQSNSFKEKLETTLELKDTVKKSYKKIMISHCNSDKEIVDVFEELLIHCGFKSDEIIYTSSQNYESRIKPYTDLYEYLREFFVNTTIRTDLCVVYIVGNKFTSNWNTALEAGAGWVVKTTSFPLYIDDYYDIKKPLNENEFIPKIHENMNLNDLGDLALGLCEICKYCRIDEPDPKQLIEYMKETILYER